MRLRVSDSSEKSTLPLIRTVALMTLMEVPE